MNSPLTFVYVLPRLFGRAVGVDPFDFDLRAGDARAFLIENAAFDDDLRALIDDRIKRSPRSRTLPFLISTSYFTPVA